MTDRTKGILINSLAAFRLRNEDKKKSAIKFIETELERNERGLHTIGMGLDCDMVQAGKIFLRISRWN